VQDHDEHKKKAFKTYEHKIKTSRRGRCWVSKTHEHEIKMKEEKNVVFLKHMNMRSKQTKKNGFSST
jgi:hypothetical protein